MNVVVVFADDPNPEPTPTSTPTEQPTDPSVDPTPTSTPLTTETPSVSEQIPAESDAQIADVLEQLPENVGLVILDENGDSLPLASQAALDVMLITDPVWCPANVPIPTPGENGCSASFASIQELVAAMQNNPESFSQNGTIFLEEPKDGFTTPLILTDSDDSLGASFNTLSLYDLTVQGGWNPTANTISEYTTFNGANGFVQIGSSSNPWAGSVTINNLIIQGVTSTTNASLAVTSNGSVSLNDVIVTGSGTGQNGIDISASNVALTDVTASYSDLNGIAITNPSSGIVTLNNVIASNNGHVENSTPFGSGLLINGNDTLVNVIGGSFTNNARYGIEALNSNSTTIPVGNIWTDQPDYVPGSVVTIGGNDNSLNGNNIGFTSGETVHVDVTGPNGYTATCEATANEYGNWSCEITLWSSDLAVGDYSYTATGLISGVSLSGTFKDNRTITSATLNGGATVTVTAGATITVVVNVTTDTTGNSNWLGTQWQIGAGAPTCVNTPDHNGAGSYSETFTITAPAIAGTYNISFVAYQNNTCAAGASATFTLNNAIIVSTIANQTITVTTNAPATAALNSSFTVAATSTSGLVVTYSSGSPAVCTNTGATFTMIAAVGTCVVRYNQAGNASFNPAPQVTQNTTAQLANQTITVTTNAPATAALNSSFTVAATASSGLPVAYSSGSPAVCTNVGATFTIIAAVGTCVVQYNQAGNASFNPAPQVTQNTTAQLANQTITVTTNAPATAALNSSFTVAATASSGLPVTYGSGSPAVCTNIGATFTMIAAVGTCVVQYNQVGNASFNPAPQVTQNTTAQKLTPVITFGPAPTPTHTGGNFIISATTTNTDSNILVYSQVSGPCTLVSNSTFSSSGSGTCFVQATGASTVNFNAASAQQSITIAPNTAPTLNLPGPITAEAASSAGATVSYSASASDAEEGAITPLCSFVSGAQFPLGITSVNCSATDLGGLTTAGSFSVTIEDTTAPVIATHANVTAEATSAFGAVASYTSPSTSDVVDGTGTAACLPASGTTFALGNTTVTCNATDANSNPAIATTFVVHIVDTTAPVIAAHADVTAAATSALGAVVSYISPATSDAVDGTDTAACLPASGGTFPLGNTTVTCDATDANGNPAISTTFVIHVVDADAPVIAPHLDITAEATSSSGATVSYTSPATSDTVDGAGIATCLPASGTVFALGDTTVTCNATDTNGNPAVATTFVVRVVDTTAPVISAHANVTATTNNSIGTTVAYSTPTTTDSVDGIRSTSCIPSSGSFFPLGNTLVTCNATDANGNAAQPITFTVIVSYIALTQPQPAPQQQTNSGVSGGFTIPLTGGSLLQLDCLTIANAFDVKITFYNLCGYQAIIIPEETGTLPSQLPAGFSFVKALNILIRFNGIPVKYLPIGTGIQFDFPIPANSQEEYAVLLWDHEAKNGKGEWLDVTQLLKDKDRNQALFTKADDELYQILPTEALKAFYRVFTADKTGTFVLVKK